ncbi:MAG TPA: T9SS type A sorting domain-containing protein [Flavobacterium sp.]|jgi:pimeloyl-ACP methyl ester carboxylesterase
MNLKITQLLFLFIAVASVAQSRKTVHDGGTQNVNVITPIMATIAYQGYDETEAYFGEAEYEIFPDNTNGIFDKPIILLDGFDPNDGRSITAIYELLNYGTGQNLADDLRNLGYDVVILNFPNYTRTGTSTVVSGGSDYIQRNAMVLAELLNQVNAMKVGDEQNVVIGPSMGGVIARYGLRYMEMNSLDHDTRLYLSFDAPHKGANIPIGFQHLFNYMAYGPLGDATVQVVVDAMLRSTASRQLLIDHFEAHLEEGSAFEFDPAITLPTGKPGFRDAFQNELDAMGFPLNTRNVAIANGSGSGQMNGTPDMVVMDHTFNITATQRAIINLRFAPAAGQTNQVSRFRGQINVFGFWITGYESMANSQAPAASSGLDSAPGGRFDLTSLEALAGSNAMLTEFFDNLMISYFTFVPTLSALAVPTITNWYAPVTALTTTPFAATEVPTENQGHVTLTDSNLAFALAEILNPPMAVTEHNFAALQIQNPVGNQISIYAPEVIANAAISVTDIMGKNVYSVKNQNIESNYQIPVSLHSGMYFLTISNSEGRIVKKLVKN